MGSPLTALQPSPQVLWQAPFQTVVSGSAGAGLSGAWRLLLLGDGSPTRHLELLSGFPVTVELIAMTSDPDPDRSAPLEIHELSTPLLRRQVWAPAPAGTRTANLAQPDQSSRRVVS